LAGYYARCPSGKSKTMRYQAFGRLLQKRFKTMNREMSAKRPVADRHLKNCRCIQNFKPARYRITGCYLMVYQFLAKSRFKILNRRFYLNPEGRISVRRLIKKRIE
jgi:hypothetical protein